MAHRFETFDDFWPYYVRAHSKKSTRVLHFLGTTAGVTSAVTGLLTGRLGLLLAAPLLGYGPAWFGHFVLEGNVPATLAHPLWSLRADFVMLAKMLEGTMDAEVQRVLSGDRAPGDRAPGDRAPGDRAPGDRAPSARAPSARAPGDRAPVVQRREKSPADAVIPAINVSPGAPGATN